ncbi:MAG: Type II secretion system protein D precursor [Candidatus Omnitrophica bacterium ADurb.Bin205]|nr:MAG: Type II secretion system protein D precursor [Candidatus Omnitrophica bacterium ADurb.Bin205]
MNKIGTATVFHKGGSCRKNVRCPYLLFFFIPIYLLSVLPLVSADKEELAGSESISLDLKNVDIIELLRIISLKTGKTIVPSKDISGRITVFLSNVKFADVLDIILLSQSLAVAQKENVYYIMTEAEYKKLFGKDYIDPRKLESVKLKYAKPSIVFSALGQLKSDIGKIVVDESTGTIILIDIPDKLKVLKEAVIQLDKPLKSAVYDLNYIKAADAKTQISAIITPGTGNVIVDERSGKAIVTDLPQRIDNISEMVRKIDEEARQVYIEADIIELTLSDGFQRGIDWEKVWTSAAMDGLALAGYFPVALTAYQKISVGTLAVDHYKGILNFLDTYGKLNIISQPRIAVVNNEEASIMVGIRDAYITQTQSQATSTTVTAETVEFIDVGVKLKVVPRIGSDGFITMKITPEVSSVKETIETKLGSRIPIVQTSQSETTVKVKDGMMIMIAGMKRVESSDDIKGWPVLSRMPFIGTFFGNRDKQEKNTEVIIFLTPHLIRGDEGLYAAKLKEILPFEHLPGSTQQKIVREEVMDEALYNYIPMPEVYQEPVKDEVQKEEIGDKIKQAEGKKQAERLEAERADSEKKAAMIEEAINNFHKGVRQQELGNTKEAITFYRKAIDANPYLTEAYNKLGILYEEEGLSNLAEDMYLKAVEIDPKYAAAYSNLALLNQEKGDEKKAKFYWKKRASLGSVDDPWVQRAKFEIGEGPQGGEGDEGV